MKTIGLLGGMSWESSREYYRLFNEGAREHLGGLHSAEVVIVSLDFGPVSEAMSNGDWETVQDIVLDRARRLAASGAEICLLGTNTMHKYAREVAAVVAPAHFIHIGECAAEEAGRRGYGKVALMGTRFTMEEAFYRDEFEAAGVSVVVPDEGEREWINSLIFDELCAGIFRDEARLRLAEITRRLAGEGADAVVLGCTELPLVLTLEHCPLPTLDTLQLHAAAALKAALD